jgi:pSer/pThr/pTyr-binding forkhead associated (FHA) protein
LISVNPNSSSLQFEKDSYVIGRSSKCDYAIPSEGISGQHCQLWRELIDPSRNTYIVWIQDTRFHNTPLFISLMFVSLNGTYVNSERIKNGQKKILQSGARGSASQQEGYEYGLK